MIVFVLEWVLMGVKNEKLIIIDWLFENFIIFFFEVVLLKDVCLLFFFVWCNYIYMLRINVCFIKMCICVCV